MVCARKTKLLMRFLYRLSKLRIPEGLRVNFGNVTGPQEGPSAQEAAAGLCVAAGCGGLSHSLQNHGKKPGALSGEPA